MLVFRVYMYNYRAVAVKDILETSYNHCVLKVCLNIDRFTGPLAINLAVNSAQQFLANISLHAFMTIYFLK